MTKTIHHGMLSKISLLIFCLFLISGASFAQKNNLHTNSKKAKKYFNKAYEIVNNAERGETINYPKAIEYLDKAIQKDNRFIDAYMFKAEMLYQMRKNSEAVECLKRVIEINPTYSLGAYVSVGNYELNNGNYKEALRYFDGALRHQDISDKSYNAAIHGKNNCEFALDAVKNPVPFEPKNMGEAINSPLPEYYPSFTLDEKTILYTRHMGFDRNRYGSGQEDFYIAHRDKDVWEKSERFTSTINTSVINEGAPSLSGDGKYLVYTICQSPAYNYGPGKTGYGSCDLFWSKNIGGQWSRPRNLGDKINTSNWESQPCIDAQGKTLYFIRGYSRRSGKMKNQDIYVSYRIGNRWSKAKKISNVINTESNEESVFIHPDGRTLFFSSDGHTGMGGLDIFVSSMNAQGEWSQPKNLGYPINTYKDENSIIINSKGDLAYFASDREGGYGELDLYSFELPLSIRPIQVSYLKGIVSDKENGKRLSAKFQLFDVKSGDIIVESYSDATLGDFLISLPTDRQYALHVTKEGYLFYSESFTFDGEHSLVEPWTKNIELQSIKVGEPIVLKNVFFDLDKYELKKESFTELNKTVDFLKKNPNLKIEIGGHTDNTGNKKHNKELSKNRAKSVYNYLIEKGIANNRLSYAGYGQDQPIQPNDTEANRAENRRTELKIIE